MPFRAVARLGTSAVLTAALLPLAGPAVAAPAVAEPAPRTETVHVPLRDALSARSGGHLVRTATPFKMVGLTWTGAAPDRVEVRTRDADGWSRWTTLERLPDSSATEALWTGDSTDAEVRATRDRQDVTDQLEFIGINPPAVAPEAPAPVAASPVAAPAPASPPVITRAQWGADESKMTWAPEPTTLKAATVHHTAGTNDYSCADSAAIVRGIYQYHAVELGWGDIGYHSLVDKCGTVFEGRAGGLQGNVIGGHARGFNRHTFAVSMMGNYDEVQPSPAAVDAVARMASWKLSTAGIPADGRTQLTAEDSSTSQHPAGAVVELPTIFAHRDVGQTACPGRFGYERMGDIRAIATSMQRSPQP